MTIADIHWYTYRIPFRQSFTTAHGVMTVREGMIVEVITTQGIVGTGEIAPLPEHSGASLADASQSLPVLKKLLMSQSLHEALVILEQHAYKERVPSSTHCGLEIALLDTHGKVEGLSLSELLLQEGNAGDHKSTPTPLSSLHPTFPSLAQPRSHIPVNAVIGATSLQRAVTAAQQAVHEGFACIKLKVGMCQSIEEEVERVSAIRNAIGANVHLRLDANEAWNLETALTLLSRLEPYTIQYIEQPLPAEKLADMRLLRRSSPIPLAADEAIDGIDSARRVLDQEAADVLIIKPQLAGGLRTSQQIIREAATRGVQSVITNTLETGIGLVAALHLAAASPVITMACGLGTLPLLADDLLVDDLPIQHGTLVVPTQAGLGVQIDRSYRTQEYKHYASS